MTEQNTAATSELLQQASASNEQAQKIAEKEIEKMWKRGQRLKMVDFLEIVKQQGHDFSKDELFNLIFSSYFLGDYAGEAFTPDNISELILAISKIYTPSTVIDICCGFGNTLSYFKGLQVVQGIDINSESTQVAQYISPAADIAVANTLEHDFKKAKYDLVIAQPPFGLWVDNQKYMEIKIIQKGLDILNTNGVAIFIVSNDLLNNRTLAEFRQNLLSNYSIDMIISLPSGTFPHTGIKTSMLVLRNGKKNKEIFMPAFDGNSNSIVEQFKQHIDGFYYAVDKITDRLDRDHYVSLEAIEKVLEGHELKKLADISTIISGKALKKELFKASGKYISFNRKAKDGKNFIDDITDMKCLLRPNDIVVSLVGQNNKFYFYQENNIKTVITNNYAIIRPDKDDYVSTYLQTEEGKKLFQLQINRHLTGVIPRLSISDLSKITIPCLPLSELNKLITETWRLNNETEYFLRKSSKCIADKLYSFAKKNVERAFENIESEEKQHKNMYLQNIEHIELLEKKDQELEEKNKQLQQEIKEKEIVHKALHEKEKEMLSFFTHTMRNALATAPESLRQAIRLLGSDDYATDKKHYKAINKIVSLFSTLSLTDCLIDTFKQSVSEPEEFQRTWKNDTAGDATPKWVIASALRQSLNRIIFMSDTSELRLLLNNAETGEVIAIRKSFIENILPLNLDSEGVDAFYHWLSNIASIEVSIDESRLLNFGANQVKFSLLFAISSELILNALKYWDGTGKIQVSWEVVKNHYVLRVTNPCQPNASSNLAGTHKGLAFIQRLVDLLGKQASFTPLAEGQHFIAELKLHASLLEDDNEYIMD